VVATKAMPFIATRGHVQILMNAVKSDATMSVLTLPVHTNAFVTKATSLILMTKRVFRNFVRKSKHLSLVK